jgi:glucuronate isomerase
MDMITLSREMEKSLASVPLLDAHTHLDATHLTARGLHDILLYHMVVSDLVSAGCPDRERLPENPTDDEAAARIERALPYIPRIANTSMFWGVRIILEDLYGWRQPVTSANWRKLDALIRAKSKEKGRGREIQAKAGIARSCTELWRRHDGRADAMLQYSLEWGFFGRAKWGEHDTALWELEKAWSEGKPSAPSPIGPDQARAVPERTVRTLADVHAALDSYVDNIPANVLSTAQHISTDVDFRVVDDRAMAAALRRRSRAGRPERDIYASYIMEEFFKRLEQRKNEVVFQFSLGAEPLPAETASRLSQATMASLADMVSRHPGIKFQCFLSSGHANQTVCTLARELPNFSLAGYWWHSFFPTFIERVMRERLDMLSTSRWIGFFSDAYTMEWSYSKAVLVRKVLARVLADKVLTGQYDKPQALGVAREILFETPHTLLGIEPAVSQASSAAKSRQDAARKARAATVTRGSRTTRVRR